MSNLHSNETACSVYGATRTARTMTILLVALFFSQANAGLFSNRLDDLKKMVSENRIDEAMDFLDNEEAWFDKLQGKDSEWVIAFRKRVIVDKIIIIMDDGRYLDAMKVLAAAAGALTGLDPNRQQLLEKARLELESQVDILAQQAIDSLESANALTGDIARWKALNTAQSDIVSVATVLNDIAPYLLKAAPASERIRLVRTRIQDQLTAHVHEAFAEYGYFSEPDFLKVYPTSLPIRDLTSNNADFEAKVSGATAGQLRRFIHVYPISQFDNGTKEILSKAYLKALIFEQQPRSYFEKQKLYQQARAESFEIIPNEGIQLVRWVTLPVNDGRLIFKNYETVPNRLIGIDQKPSELLRSNELADKDLIVFLRPSPLQVTRTISAQTAVNSKYQSGTRRISNPAYAQARNAVVEAEETLADFEESASQKDASSSSAGLDLLVGVVGIVGKASAERAVSKAKERLVGTPQMIDEPVMTPYSYTRSDYQIDKRYNMNAAVYDRVSGRIWTKAMPRFLTRQFSIYEGVNRADPSATSVSVNGATMVQVEQFQAGVLHDDYEIIWKDLFAQYGKAMQ